MKQLSDALNSYFTPGFEPSPAKSALHTLSDPQRRVLRIAAKRAGGFICPIGGVYAAASTALLASLERKGLIDPNGGCPVINEAGRAAITKATGTAS